EENVTLGGYEDPEVACPTLFDLLHEHTGCIDAQVRLLERILTHRTNERLGERCELGVPAAHRRAGEIDAVTPVDIFEAIERQMVLPALDDRVGEHAGTGEPFWDRQLRRLADEHLGRRVPLALLTKELRADDSRDDERGRPSLEYFADFLADSL